jgi:hypothetical protein
VPRRDDAASRADRARNGRSRPPALADAVERAGYPFRVGCAPPEDELGRLWARVRTLPSDDAERLVVGEMFATLNVRAMLPAMRTAVREWRPDVIVREHAEFASLVAAEEAGVPHLQVGISLAATHMRIVWIAAKPVEAWGTGLADRIAETPCLTLFPASLEDPEVAGPPTRLPLPRPGRGRGGRAAAGLVGRGWPPAGVRAVHATAHSDGGSWTPIPRPTGSWRCGSCHSATERRPGPRQRTRGLRFHP